MKGVFWFVVVYFLGFVLVLAFCVLDFFSLLNWFFLLVEFCKRTCWLLLQSLLI